MSKINKKKLLSDSIIFNIIGIGVVGVLLIILTLLFMNIYTRHGNNVIVPDLKGLQAEEAEQTPKPSNKVKEGRNIYITIYSYSPQQIAIPDLVDYSSRQAISLLNSIGFTDIEIVEKPAQYSGIVLSVEYKGRRLKNDEMVPLGQPIRLIVGTSNVGTDSLDVNDDFLTHPSIDNDNSTTKKNTDLKGSKMDDSFF